MNKTLVISINSPFEKTGGGLYLKTLLSFFGKYGDVDLVSKYVGVNDQSFVLDSGNNVGLIKSFKKSFLSDLVSRFFFQPTFLAYYFFQIVFISRNYERIVIHNSRNGFLAFLLSLIFKYKNIMLCSDNVERDLSASSQYNSSFLKGLVSRFDSLLLIFVEKTYFANLDYYSFITINDYNKMCEYYSRKNIIEPLILPILLPTQEVPALESYILNENSIRILFTASFDFAPNIVALNNLLVYARKLDGCTNLKFVLAGRCLSLHSDILKDYHNVEFYSDPTDSEMAHLFKSSDFYISPVTIGSGMKTKIAEALSYGLPILATSHSLIGYDSIRAESCISLINDEQDVMCFLNYFLSLSDLEMKNIRFRAYQLFLINYSVDGFSLQSSHLETFFNSQIHQ
ncbi:MAG: hypothetical protein DI594_11360 [Shewanella oneidensis]|nr:MAG: hypothetical protein DI594_11360 [Shewanella oneidensis]